jgi:hypothetical protein
MSVCAEAIEDGVGRVIVILAACEVLSVIVVGVLGDWRIGRLQSCRRGKMRRALIASWSRCTRC